MKETRVNFGKTYKNKNLIFSGRTTKKEGKGGGLTPKTKRIIHQPKSSTKMNRRKTRKKFHLSGATTKKNLFVCLP